jgi:DNA-binding response OmpR family regulator
MSQKVFLLENDKWLGDQYQQTLETAGFKVTRTTDAYDAMDMIDDDLPDVIVMSLLLSGAGAVGLLHELQSYVDTAKLPVIICTTQSSVSLEDLEPYGVKRLLNSSTMKHDDLAAAVRSVLA